MEDDSTKKTLDFQSSLQKFIDHVETLRNENDPAGDGFNREFRIIRELGIKMKEENTYPALEGRKQCNVKKNRYRDILPFDETRVILSETEGEEGSDYINANFVKDYQGTDKYICSQGPVAATVVDFWRMIWQYKVKVVAMACKLVEMGKKKCEQYWPEDMNTPAMFGDFEVTMVESEDIADDCTRRTLEVRSAGLTQIVTQFHYTGWPDHDIPNDFDVILEMIAEMRQIQMADSDHSSMIIHCSAGCGRTGTICAIDYSWDLLKSWNLNESFSLFEIVKTLRTQRQSMIQAPEQYMMAHVTVSELFKKHLGLMEDHTYGNMNFNEEDEEKAEDNDGTIRKNTLLEQEVQSMVKHVTETPSVVEGDTEDQSTQSVIQKFKVLEIENIPDKNKSDHNYTNLIPGNAENQSKPVVANGNKKPAMATQSSRIESSNQQGKFVTNISVGKTPLKVSKSEPPKTIPGAAKHPGPKHSSFIEKPQSSIAPVPPSSSDKGIYSFAAETNNAYSALSTYSSAKSSYPYSYADAQPLAKGGSKVPQQSPQLPPNKPTYPYSYAQVSPQAGNDPYSFAQETDHRDVYSMPSKSKVPAGSQNGIPLESVYEAISVGNQVRNVAPPIPLRQYSAEEEQDKLTPTNETVTPGKNQMLSNLKNLPGLINTSFPFTTGNKSSANDHTVPSDIPGFQKRIEKRPIGAREKPHSWTQQHL